jgi:adenylate kinase
MSFPAGRTFVVLFGPPGSGKGTQGQRLSGWSGLPHISTGDCFRAAISEGNPIGKYTSAELAKGQLASDGAANELVAVRLGRSDCERGAILDGYPRTESQAEELLGRLKIGGLDRCLAICLRVDYNKVVARLAGRRCCPVCQRTFTGDGAAEAASVCPWDGAKLVSRIDDKLDALSVR